MNHFPSWTISQTKLPTKAFNPSKHSSKTNRTRRWAPPTWDLRKISKGFWFISSPYETVTSSWYCPYVLAQRDELNFIRRVSNIMYKMHWLTLSIISPRLFVVQSSINAVTCSTAHISTYSFTLSVGHALSLSVRTLNAVFSNCSLIFAILLSVVSHLFRLSEESLGSHTVAQSCTLSLIQLLIRSFNIPHISVSLKLSFLLSLLIHPVCRSLLLSFYQNTDF